MQVQSQEQEEGQGQGQGQELLGVVKFLVEVEAADWFSISMVRSFLIEEVKGQE